MISGLAASASMADEDRRTGSQPPVSRLHMSRDALHTVIPLPLFTYRASADKFRSLKTQSSTSQGASLIAQLVKNLPAMHETPVRFLGREDPLIGYPLQYSWASLVGQLVKNLPAMREIWV